MKSHLDLATNLLDYFQREKRLQEEHLKLSESFKNDLLETSKAESKEVKKLFQEFSNIFNQFDVKSEYVTVPLSR